MRGFAFFAPLAVSLAVAGVAGAQTSAPSGWSAPTVTVSIGGDLTHKVRKLGEREVERQTDQLADTVRQALARDGGADVAEVHLVLTDLEPNHPTFQQAVDRPGLSMFQSVSIGGATIEGEVITADGRRLPIRYSRYSSNIEDVYNFGTWEEAEHAYDRLASNIVAGRLVER